MSAADTDLMTGHQAARGRRPAWAWAVRRPRWNVPGVAGGLAWLLIVLVPVYWMVISSLRDQAGFLGQEQLLPPSHPTLDNYRRVLDNGFGRYLLNSAIVTVATVIVVVLVTLLAAYVIVRSERRIARGAFTLFLAGLAVPSHAVIIPIYLLIIRLHLYDSLLALILPTAAFGIPVAVLVTTAFMRDIPNELFEAMRLDGASEWRILWSLAAPLSRPAMITVGVYTAIQAWNGFLFPLILTQSPRTRVLPLSLWTLQGEFTIDVPAVLAAVVLSSLPLFAAYLIGRRQLVAGLTAGFGK
ncbi:carbohydrate ABC transporter permease [Actinoallomurus sp. CA-150999]|uniref:carbohydrate ABC transporter permease n=1 Tax=Actinoallomurus sp. CA-150999 TaxID=3239887 RepID=UPI003D91B3D0